MKPICKSNTFNLKKQLRVEIVKRRNELTKEYIEAADAEIYSKVISLPEYQSAAMLFCFVSTEDEINTYPIIQHALSVGKKVCVPKCISKGIMHPFEITGLDCLEVGLYHIMEPREGCYPVYPNQIDFCIVPCMSCDKHGKRIGYGGGYYDRFLRTANCPSAVICREKLISEEIPTTDLDILIGIIVTEAGLWRV